MNKFKALLRRLGIESAIAVAIIVGIACVMVFTESMVESAGEKKTKADAALAQERSQLASMRSQLERSGEAEKRFVEIQLSRSSPDFSSSTEALTEWARNAKATYRFANNFKLNLPPERGTDKSELVGVDYYIGVREHIGMELEAISDVHVYSFIDDLRKGAPGFIRLSYLELERRGDMHASLYSQMMGGMAPNLVQAQMQFNWVGINPKEAAPANSTGAP